MLSIEEDFQAVGREVGSVREKIEAVEAALAGGPPYLGITDGDLLLEEKNQLRKKEQQLRKKEEQLREEKLLLLKKQPAAAVSLAGACELCVCIATLKSQIKSLK